LRPALYVHVPYCRFRCTYCNFYFELGRADEKFVAALERELELRRDELPAGPLPAVFLGGGTPSWLPAAELESLLALIGAYIDDRTEFTVECNPEDLDAALLELLRAGGVNRISLGLQSLNELELKRSARRHDAAGGLRALSLLAASDIEWSADLILGLPQQSRDSFQRSLERVLEFSPGHLSLYTLELDSPVPLVEVFGRRPEWDPGEDLRAELYLWSDGRLAEAGFRHYEVSNWAHPGRECRYNEIIWQGGEYMGLGPSAHSHLGGRRFSWPADLEAWIEAVKRSDLSCLLEDSRSASELRLETLLLGLRRAEGIPLSDPALSGAAALIKAFAAEGWIIEDAKRLRLSPAGWIRMDGILARLST